MRYQVYMAIRDAIRGVHAAPVKAITQNHLAEILRGLDIWSIRNSVFDLYGFGSLNEPTHRTLMKAHVVFLSKNKDFHQSIKDIRYSHQRYMTDILASDVFRDLEVQGNPLASKDVEDKIPEKYGKQWFQFRDQAKEAADDDSGQSEDKDPSATNGSPKVE